MRGWDRHFEEARARWPSIRVGAKQLEQFLKRHAPSGTQLEANAADIYLACACAAGDAAALNVFEREQLSQVGSFVARTDPSAAFTDELKQALRERLFLGEAPRIAEYSGQGPLGAWLRVVAVRAALNLKRSRSASHDGLDGVAAKQVRAMAADPELDYLKTRYGKEFREAFQRTLGKLDARDRNLLGLYYLERVSSTAIARTFKVHGTTVRRWLEDLRKQIIDETYAVLREKLRLSPSELNSLLQLVHSQLDQSVTKYLR